MGYKFLVYFTVTRWTSGIFGLNNNSENGSFSCKIIGDISTFLWTISKTHNVVNTEIKPVTSLGHQGGAKNFLKVAQIF